MYKKNIDMIFYLTLFSSKYIFVNGVDLKNCVTSYEVWACRMTTKFKCSFPLDLLCNKHTYKKNELKIVHTHVNL